MLPSSLDHCQQWFASDGRLATRLTGFQPRSAQLHMAAFILDAIVNQQEAVCEAGTGVGKTLAYLLPTLDSSKKTIVSTATKTLQKQLFDKDIPLASEVFGGGVKAFLLKGKGNYLSLNRLHKILQNPDVLFKNQRHQLKSIQQWANITETGDRAECNNIADNAPIWQYVCFQANDNNDKDDFYTKARNQAKAADLLIINHHLLCAELNNMDTVKRSILENFQHIIVDEAHHLTDIATLLFSDSFSRRQLHDTIAGCNDAIFFLPEEIRLAFIEPINQLSQLSQQINAFFLQYQPGRYAWQSFMEHTDISWVEQLMHINQTLIDLFEQHDIADKSAETAQALLQVNKRFCDALEKINRSDDVSELEDSVCWLEIRDNGFFCLYVSPISVAEKLTIYRQQLQMNWIYTSATLTVENTFDYVKQSLGLDDTAKTGQWHSPFDYSKQVAWYQPPMLLEPTFQKSSQATISPALKQFMDESINVCQLTAGGAFLLFCSYRSIQQACDYLEEQQSKQQPFKLFIQGERSNKKLLDDFKRSNRGILLGTSSFWEGIDVRGDSLRVVAIEKLPFPSPKDPLNQAREQWLKKQQKNIFHAEFLPKAIISLRQGLGRLIRDVHDTGIVLIGDNRIFTKPYGQMFINSLPDYCVISDFAQLQEYWQQSKP